jgi:transposase
MTLVHLPPYSPELNAAENIWEYLRRICWSGRLFDSYDAIVEAICSGWNQLISEAGRIQSIASRKWAAQVRN